ncbi:GL14453, partial [Drosophila persimilis]
DDDDEGLLEDDDLPLAEVQQAADEDEGNWFSQGVHRVRRSLSRIFGGDGAAAAEKTRNRRGIIERQQERRRRAREERERSRLDQKHRLQEQKERQKVLMKQVQQQLHNRATEPRKRASELYDETEGSSPDVDEETSFYRTYFTIAEPYTDEFADRNSEAFLNLQKLLEEEIRKFFVTTVDDDELDIRSTLLRVEGSCGSAGQRAKVVDWRWNEVLSVCIFMSFVLSCHFDVGCLHSRKRPNAERQTPNAKRRTPKCQPNEYRCRSGHCIDAGKRCDYRVDCPDGDDENEECPAACSGMEYQCRDGTRCISVSQQCDGQPDCSDGDDEEHCDGIVPKLRYTCPKGKFTCRDLSCISIVHRCDGRADCPHDRSDEEGCPCLYDKWQCDDGTCIAKELLCNGNIDCPEDISDERYCEGGFGVDDDEQCRFDEFRCGTGECIPMRQVCDNIYDCNDYTDEIGCGKSGDEDVGGIGIAIDHHRPTPKGWDNEVVLPELEYLPVGRYNKPDPQNKCASNQFHCVNTDVCIPLHLRCDGYYHCNDMSDEADCERYQPPPKTRRPPTIRVTTRSPWDFSPDSLERRTTEGGPRGGVTIRPTSPTATATATATTTNPITTTSSTATTIARASNCLENIEFACHNHDCIPIESVCDGIADCGHHEDEDYVLCNCSSDKYKCQRGGGCIPKTQVCDGKSQCHDGSDESACHFQDKFNKTRLGVECLSFQYQCGDGSCISGYKRCNGITDCADGADEYNCLFNYEDVDYDTDPDNNPLNECDILEFECDLGQCLPLEKKCDGYTDCGDETDELDCPAFTEHCLENEFECDEYCMPRDQLCNGIANCNDGSDERNCTFCRDDAYLCNTGECIADNQRCNGHADCTDASDERHCARVACPWHKMACNGTCVNRRIRCDGKRDCSDGRDERDCPTGTECKDHEFLCFDRQFCINATQHCDGYYDCKDFSDEQNCIGRHHEADTTADTSATSAASTSTTTVSPSTTSSPPLRIICPATLFRCENGPCIALGLRCNGLVDCPYDSSDEADCGLISNEIEPNEPDRTTSQLNLKTYPDSQIIKERREVIFRCRDEGPFRAKVRWTRPGGQPLPPGFTDRSGRLEIPNIRLEDSGTYVCEAVGYPSYQQGQQVTVHLTVERSWGEHKYEELKSSRIRYGTVPHIDLEFFGLDNDLGARPSTACSQYQATCMNGDCIDKSNICDGIPHCSDGSDEHSCSHGRKCQPNQFLCNNSKCVDRTWRCDGENDCGDSPMRPLRSRAQRCPLPF